MEQVKFVKDSLKKILLAPFLNTLSHFQFDPVSEAYSELSQTSEMELYAKTVNRYRSSHRRCSIKKVFLKISQNSQESTCSRVSFLSLWHRCFPVNAAKFLRTPFLQNTSKRLLLPLEVVYSYGRIPTTSLMVL